MSRTEMVAGFAAMLAVATPLAHGQTMPTAWSPNTPPSETLARESPPANHLLPGQIRATELDGADVYDRDNRNIGDIKEVIIDRDGHVATVIINVGATLGLGGRHVAVGFDNLTITNDANNRLRVTVNLSRAQLKSAQVYNLSERSAASGTSTPTPPERED